MPATLPPTPGFSTRLLSARRWIVLAMLLALHAALVTDPGGAFQRIWLIVHFGLFLLWQPFVAAEQELERLAVVMLLAITGVIIYFLPGWLIVAWISVLLGILGGKVFTLQARRQGRFYLVAFFYLAAILIVWAVPSLVIRDQVIPPPVVAFVQSVLPFSLVALAFLPFDSREDDHRQVFDFFYAVLVFQLVVVLVLGAVALTRYTNGEYFTAAGLTVIGFGGTLIVLAVLWGPRQGFGGLRTYLSRYLMSVGMPFEIWVRRVADLAEREPDPQRFLHQALSLVSELPWVRGGEWRSPEGEGTFGEKANDAARFAFHGVDLTFYTEIDLSPALFLHMRLLAQVVGEFYESKRREAEMRRNAYVQAVHETGARLTHDIKNLLQSLFTLTSAAPRDESFDAKYAQLLSRQLPQITRRLQTTLDQLRSPQVEIREPPRSVHAWWKDLERRTDASGVLFELHGEGACMVPASVFDGFVENCLVNARRKRDANPGMNIRVSLHLSRGRASLEIEDSGDPVPASIAEILFDEPIPREGGAGFAIGLYQLARLAAQSGYMASLARNEPGRVVFRLEPA
ncbi:MAG: sensor histidine kinase [Betaproteobacteria bacterium]|nr:sensor histidine kinase [Betaproteobacteria bacterium]